MNEGVCGHPPSILWGCPDGDRAWLLVFTGCYEGKRSSV